MRVGRHASGKPDAQSAYVGLARRPVGVFAAGAEFPYFSKADKVVWLRGATIALNITRVALRGRGRRRKQVRRRRQVLGNGHVAF